MGYIKNIWNSFQPETRKLLTVLTSFALGFTDFGFDIAMLYFWQAETDMMWAFLFLLVFIAVPALLNTLLLVIRALNDSHEYKYSHGKTFCLTFGAVIFGTIGLAKFPSGIAALRGEQDAYDHFNLICLVEIMLESFLAGGLQIFVLIDQDKLDLIPLLSIFTSILSLGFGFTRAMVNGKDTGNHFSVRVPFWAMMVLVSSDFTFRMVSFSLLFTVSDAGLYILICIWLLEIALWIYVCPKDIGKIWAIFHGFFFGTFAMYSGSFAIFDMLRTSKGMKLLEFTLRLLISFLFCIFTLQVQWSLFWFSVNAISGSLTTSLFVYLFKNSKPLKKKRHFQGIQTAVEIEQDVHEMKTNEIDSSITGREVGKIDDSEVIDLPTE